QLRERLGVVADLEQASALLGWDQHTYMPPGGVEARGRQSATLARIRHEHLSAPALRDLLEALEAAELAGDDAALVREARREVEEATRMPADLVAALSLQQARGQAVWARARAADDFAAFVPELRAMVGLQRERAAALGDGDAYDVLHDRYERGSTAARVSAVFEPLRGELVALLDRVRGSDVRPDVGVLTLDVPEAAQEAFAVEVVRAFGYDFGRGRLDRTVHPFAQRIGSGDVRITTRFRRDALYMALFGTMHEAGHGMYEQNLPAAEGRTPVGASVSLAVHESQSRLWENLVGRSRPFWTWAYPRLQRHAPGVFDDVPVERFVGAINAVRPSLVRVEADELTYHLHVMLRFDLERALVSGELEAGDLPAAWAEGSRRFGLPTPPDDRLGCLQDVHWSAGLFGYFPTYSLGTLLSVQWWEAIARDVGDLDGRLAAGDFAPILAWLVEHVHAHGSRFAPGELIERATGAPLSAEPFLRYARAKYGELYALA
ncbi:MAG: carboxypeptidase M32, partial [Trueperaceae bacterium]|nr:carboxypeptidase M32 [Trueperaceae bacterium]